MKGWVDTYLGEVLRLEYGKPLPANRRSDSGNVPVYGANGILAWTDTPFRDQPSIIVGRKGTAGAVTLVNEPYWPIDVTYFVEYDRNLHELRFLYYLLVSVNLPSLAKGVKPGINRNDAYAIPVKIPSLEEQQRIVALLDEAFEAIDQAITNTEKNLANARELFTASFQERVATSGLEWQTYLLPEISENLDSKRRPITKSNRVAGGVPYYGASGQVDSVRDYLFDESLLLISEDGANLLMRTYPIAFSITGKSWVNNHAHVLRFFDIATQRLVEYYFNETSIANWVTGMAQPKLNQKSLNSIPVPLPPQAARAKLVSELDDLNDTMEKVAQTYEERMDRLATLKQSLLERAFSGELTADSTTLAA